MISFLRGTLAAKQAPLITLDVGGIGYDVETPMSTYLQLPAVGSELTILTHFLVREDAQLLYGFSTDEERDLFRSLLKVSGVGARIALAILSGISVAGFRQCVEFDDVSTLIKVPGVGRKTAERLIVEMRDRLQVSVPVAGSKGLAGSAAPQDNGRSDALQALLALGYKDAEVRKMLATVAKQAQPTSTEEYIRLCLKQMAGSGAA